MSSFSSWKKIGWLEKYNSVDERSCFVPGDHKHVLDNETEEGEEKVKSVFFEWSPRNGRHLAGGQQQPATWIETTWTASAAKLYKMSNVIWSIILKSWDTEVLKIKIKIFIQTNFTLNLNKFVGFGKRGAEIEFVFVCAPLDKLTGHGNRYVSEHFIRFFYLLPPSEQNTGRLLFN